MSPGTMDRALSRLSATAKAGVGVFILGAGLLTFGMRHELRPLRAVDGFTVMVEDLNDGGASLRERGVVSGEGAFVPDGLSVSPGGSTEVVLWLPDPGPSRQLSAKVWMYRAPGLSSVVECSGDGVAFHEIHRDVHAQGALLALDACPERLMALRFRFSRQLRSSPREIVALDRIAIRSVASEASAPGLIPLLTSWVTLAIVTISAVSLQFRLRDTALLVACAVAVLLAASTWPSAFSVGGRRVACLSPVLLAQGGLVALVLWVKRRSPIDRARETLLLVFLLLVAFGPRWEALVGALDRELWPDAQMVHGQAIAMTHLFDTWTREPLWIWLVRATFLLVGENHVAGRLFSLLTGMLWLSSVYFFVRLYWRSLSMAAGVLAWLAIHPALITSSSEGHRTELYGLMLMLVAISALTPHLGVRTRVSGLVLGLTGVVWTQLAGVIPAVGAIAYGILKKRVTMVTAAAALVMASIAILPHGIYTHRQFGQAFYFQRTLVPVFYRNYEFLLVKRTGCDGCPDPVAMAQDGFSGRPISMATYLFELHRPGEVFTRIATGYWKVFVGRGIELLTLLGSSTHLLYLLYLIGLVAALLTPARVVLLIPVLSLNLLAFVIPLGLDLRLILHIAPFTAMLVVLGTITAFAPLARVTRARWSR